MQRGGKAVVIQLTMRTIIRQSVCRHLYKTDLTDIIHTEYPYPFNCSRHFTDKVWPMWLPLGRFSVPSTILTQYYLGSTT